MRAASARLFEYSLPLARPLPATDDVSAPRRGLLLQLADADGHLGWGEIAPLPGFSPESLDEARGQASFLCGMATAVDIPDAVIRLDGSIGRLLDPLGLHASVRCGIETAVLNLYAAARNQSMASLLAEHPRNYVWVNGLITSETSQIAEQARLYLDEGYRSVKMKVGSRAVREELNRVQALRETLGDGVSIRLDANRSFEFDDAVAFANAIAKLNIEYIEEPLREYNRLPDFARTTGAGVALDEILVDVEPEEFEPFPGLRAIIIKPTLLGGFERSAQFARRAGECGVLPVVSSTFESGVGILALAQLAAAIVDPDTPCGLDTLRWFEDDVLMRHVNVSGGKIDLGTYQSGIEIDPRRLIEVVGA